jgi:hypothetical protein
VQALATLDPDAPLAPELFGYRLYNHLHAAAKRYSPRPYAGSMVLFRATQKADMHYLDAGKTLGWDRFVHGGIRVLDIPSCHYTLLTEPGLQPLVQALQRELASPVEEAPAAPARPLARPQAGPSLA